MEEEWLGYLRENEPELYAAAVASVKFRIEWRENSIHELERRLAAMEANMPKSAIDLERENFALRERLAAVEGLPRYVETEIGICRIEYVEPRFRKGLAKYVDADELQAALRSQEKGGDTRPNV